MTNMTNEIQVQNDTLPAYMRGTSYAADDINVSEIKIPWMLVGQHTSGPVKEEKVKYGEIYSTTGEVFGKQIDIIVVKPFVNWVRFDKGKGMVGRSYNGQTWEEGELIGQELIKTKENDETFKCKRYNFYVIKAGQGDAIPYILSMYSSSGGKTGSDLYNKIALSMVKNSAPCFARKYTLSTIQDKNDIGDFNSWRISDAGFVAENDFKIAAEARKFIDTNKVKHDEPIIESPVVEKGMGDF